ncbi:MAG: hypothetical protein NWE89_11000 [Candidatus Bathyarchaeota archaeon]|nr:hypothetical protein [Candidatus Bathyarchaeota archaeon]
MSDEEAWGKFKEFEEKDPLAPWGCGHQVYFSEIDEDLAGV